MGDQPVSVGFVQVDLASSIVRDRDDRMEIVLRDGRSIRIHPGFHSESLQRLVTIRGLIPFCIQHGDINFSGDITAGDAQAIFGVVFGQLHRSVVK
jgi:hypothetical protein